MFYLVENIFSDTLLNEITNRANNCEYFKHTDDVYSFEGNLIVDTLKQKILSELSLKNINIIPELIRVQRITPDLEVNENFHKHNKIYDTNVVVFINDDYEGGEFVYILDGVEHIIKPENNLGMVFSPDILHKVLNVTKGTRYTLVSFANKNNYPEKHLI